MVELDAILARRSIRKYTSELVTDEDIKKLLEAAMAAPTGGNRKPWHFIIIKERETLDRLAVRHPYGKMLTEAPLCIAVCGDPSLTPLPRNFIPQDCSAATMNILHAAVALGLGAVWIGLALDEHYDMARSLLGIPEDIVPHNLIAIGHPAEQKEPRTQYDETRVHSEKW
ncbi:MAG: nitroreductase family protein [Candidatus Bathyarchaeota archaeon]